MKIIDSSLNRFYTKFEITNVLLGIQTLKEYHTKHKFLMANGTNSDMDERELKFPQIFQYWHTHLKCLFISYE